MESRIPFEYFLNRGVRKETTENMTKSFLGGIYAQSYILIKTILQLNKDISGNYSVMNEMQNSIQNVIAYTGRRGTGKTSAMLSFANNLTSGKSNFQETFYALPYTDVSVLEENEDVFLIVLSKMLNLIHDSMPTYNHSYNVDINEKINSIKERICTVYDHYLSIREKDPHNLNSSYSLMEKTLAKCNVRTEFAKLVSDYINLLNQINNRKNTDGYLIICIDDVDMVKNTHLRIMQDIHQYFMIPNVIVMVTLSFPVLSAALQKEYFSNFNTIRDKEEYNFHLSFEQTNDFLRKIIPSDMRITMPSWRKSDYRDLVDVEIGFSKDLIDSFDEKFKRLKNGRLYDIIKKYFENDKNNNIYTVSPKELIMIVLSERTEIYLDVYGQKFHFMEPDSLRNLYDMFYLLYDMENINDDTETSEINKIKNRKIVLDYLHFKMLPGNDFSINVKSLIDDFLEEPLERRGFRIWDYYFKCLNSGIEKERICSVYGEDFYNEEKKKYIIENYSFGEVFRVLYSASRLGLEKMNRKFIKFILASFSFSFPQYVEKERKEIVYSFKNGRNQHDKHIANLSSIFGYSLIGTWRKDLFNGNDIDIVFSVAGLQEIFEKKQFKDEQIADFVNIIVAYLMLSSRSFDSSINVYSIDDYVLGGNDIKYNIDIRIDPTAFIINTLEIDERMSSLKFMFEGKEIETTNNTDDTFYSVTELIIIILSKHKICKKEDLKIRKKVNECIKNAIDSIKSEVLNDMFPWFLIQNIDLTYNVIKRTISSIIYKSKSNVKEKRFVNGKPLAIIKAFYQELSKHLDEEDKIYLTSFSNSFENNFIVKRINEEFSCKCMACEITFHKKAHVDKMLCKLFASLQDRAGIFWADISALKLYYSEYLYNEIETADRKDILTFIGSYRNHEMSFITLIGLIDEILGIHENRYEDESSKVEEISTLNDCLTRLQDSKGEMWSDIESLRYYFADELEKNISRNQVKLLIILVTNYRNKNISFEDLIAQIKIQLNGGEKNNGTP